MNSWGLPIAAISATTSYVAWRMNHVRSLLIRAEEAWNHTEKLLGKRREIAHQIVVYADQAGLWDQKLMDKLISCSASSSSLSGMDRLSREDELVLSIKQAIEFLVAQASETQRHDVELMRDYFRITEKKIEFATHYYTTTRHSIKRRLDRRIAKVMVRFRVVPGNVVDLGDSRIRAA